MDTVIVIKRYDTDSWHSTSGAVVAVAENEVAAKSWIQDEVDGKHGSNAYMQGKDADWWIKYGTFTLTTMPIQKEA